MGGDIEGYLNFNYTSTSGSNTINITKGRTSDFNVGDVIKGPGIPTGTTITGKTSSTLTMSNAASGTHTTAQLGFVYNASIKIKVTGTAPNRKCIVQWKNFSRYISEYSTPGTIYRDRFTFQLILSETTNEISFVYNSLTPDNTLSLAVGLKGLSDSDYFTRAGSWTSSTSGSLSTTMSTYASSFPTSGYTFKFVPPNCFTPPTDMTTTIDPSTGNPTVSWTLPIIGAPTSGYYYYLSTSPTLPNYESTHTGSIPSGTHNVTFSTLSPDSVYYFWIRSRCSSTEKGPWSDMLILLKDYCGPSFSQENPNAYYLKRVVTTSATVQNIDKTTNLSVGRMGMFTQTDSLVTEAGSTISIAVEPSYYVSGYRRAYIDYNQDNIFETSERVYNNSITYESSKWSNFTIPFNTTPGKYRMRAIYQHGSEITDPCNLTKGEVEDYTVIITQPTLNCVAAVSPTITTFLCANDNLSLKWRKSKYAESYSIYLSNPDSEVYNFIANTTDTFYHFLTSKPSGNYKWYILPNYPIYGSPTVCDTFQFTIKNPNNVSDTNGTSSQVQSASQLLDYISSNCNNLGSIYSLGGNLGNVTMESFISPTARTINDVTYLRRHFEINADYNTVTSYVTLYISKEDIIDFNDNNLTMNDIDTITGENMVVKIYHDPISIDGLGPDGHDTLNVETITPIVVFDEINQRYNVSFLSSGFSGFYITSSINSDPLSSNLGSLRVNSDKDKDHLYWNVLSHQTFKNFEIEMSQDANLFRTIGQIENEDFNSDYTFSIIKPWDYQRYYRIKAHLMNGSYLYSNVVFTKDEANDHQLELYPNPSSNKIFIHLSNENHKIGKMQIFDMNGKLMKESIIITNVKNEVEIKDLPAGNYILHTNVDGKSLKKVFSKQ